ncbi:MAG: ATP-binding protein [Polyangiaceae bacterium]
MSDENDHLARIAQLEETVRALRGRHDFLAKLDAATQPLAEPLEIMRATAQLLAEHLGVDRCAYARVDAEEVFDIIGDWSCGVPTIVGRWDVAIFGPACVEAMRANKPYVVDDVGNDPRVGPEFRAAYAATTIQAVICVPLHKHGVFTAAMAVHQKAPRRWSAFEIELVTTVAARCWEALERAAVIRTRREAETALADNRARLEYAVLLSGVGFWYCDLPFDELMWDERVKAHFWLPPDAVVTIDLFYACIHPDDREATRLAIESSIANRARYDVIYRTVDPTSKRVKHVRALGGAAYGRDGEPIRFDGVTLDVTALREHDQRKDEFLATLAHELRNPLAPIRTGLELIERSRDRAEVDRLVVTMKRQLSHMVRMVDDLLDISRVTLGKITLVSSRVDVRTILESALDTARVAIQAADHTLEVHVAEGPLPLDVDATRIAQVFANLLSNAAKYTPRGGSIRVLAEREGEGWVAVRVTDTGIGIAAEELPAVFDMFKQLGPAIDRAEGGLGIGLTLARRLVQMHGGTISAESVGLGRGSTFTVRLPVAASTKAPVEADTRSPADPRGMRILIVDDNEDGAELLAILLQNQGASVHVAHTGPEGLAQALEIQPDVVLLDIGLPGMDGYEVARSIRAAAIPQPVLIAISGWGAEEDRQRAIEASFDHHLVKPVDHARLLEAIADGARPPSEGRAPRGADSPPSRRRATRSPA